MTITIKNALYGDYHVISNDSHVATIYQNMEGTWLLVTPEGEWIESFRLKRDAVSFIKNASPAYLTNNGVLA